MTLAVEMWCSEETGRQISIDSSFCWPVRLGVMPCLPNPVTSALLIVNYERDDGTNNVDIDCLGGHRAGFSGGFWLRLASTVPEVRVL